MRTKISQLSESALIAYFKTMLGGRDNGVLGIGDDTAVMPLNHKHDMLFTADMIVESVHFNASDKPQLIGHKALACNLSDIASMGGVPTFALISIGLPPKTSMAFVKDVYLGLRKTAKRYRVRIVGGDTVKSDKIIIHVALLGTTPKGKSVTRKAGTRPIKSGHIIWPYWPSITVFLFMLLPH